MSPKMNDGLVVSLLALGLFLTATASVSLAATGTNMTEAQWTQVMNNTPTPGIGCWTATYPNVTWVAAPCSTATVGPFGAPEGTMITRITGAASYPNLFPYFATILGATVMSSLTLLKFRRSLKRHAGTPTRTE